MAISIINAYLAICFCIKNSIKLHYYTVDKFPPSIREIKILGMQKYLPYPEFLNFFKWLHLSDWNINIFHEDFFFHKTNSDFFDSIIDNKYDIIFYNAFCYNTQPEMWGKKHLKFVMKFKNPVDIGLVIVLRDLSGDV